MAKAHGSASGSAAPTPALGPPGPGQPQNYAGATAPVAALTSDPLGDLSAMGQATRVISNVSFGTTTSYGEPGSAAAQPPLSVLEFDVAIPDSTPAARAKGTWEAAIFAGAVADRVAASPLPPLGEVGVTLVTPDGTRLDAPGGVGRVVAGQRFTDVTDAVKGAIVQRAESLGLTDVDVSTIRGLQDALIIMVRSANPAALVNGDPDLLESILGVAPTSYEGVYLEVQDATGQPVLAEGRAPRDGSGSLWTAPGSGIAVVARGPLRTNGS